MIYLLSLLTIAVVAIASARTTHGRCTKVVLTATIPRPASSIFAVISATERAPVWRRHPVWLPHPLRIATLIPCGDRPHPKRVSRHGLQGPEEIFVRQVKNREFGYRSLRRHDLSYESTFLLSPGEGKCRVTWEVQIRTHRLADILAQRFILAATQASMAHSLQWIQHVVLSRTDMAHSPGRIFAAPQDQIPAA
jgi:hypothetical protein